MRKIFTFCFLLITSYSFAQYGGSYTYAYLNLSPSARITSLGGTNITTYDGDINFAFNNPALLNKQMDGDLSVSNAIMNGNINHGYVAYGKYSQKLNITFAGGILYNAYGNFPFTDETGTQTGSFKAGDFLLHAGAGYTENKLSYGANVKFLYSQLESYSSYGISFDLAGSYVDTAKQFVASFVIKNIGAQFKSYTAANREELPFDIQFGISKRLAHLPLRISLTAHNLEQFDIRYDNPNTFSNTNIFATDSIQPAEKKYTADNLLRHLIIGGEFYFGKNLNVRVGYDHQMHKELSLETKRGLTGFSLGAGIKIKKYQIDYAHQFMSLAGGSNQITIATNLRAWIKK